MDQKNIILKDTSNHDRMVHEEIHGNLFEGDSLIVGNCQEAVFLHDDGKIPAIYKSGTFTFRSLDKWDHKGRLFYVNYSVSTNIDWHASIFLPDDGESLEIWGRVWYGPLDANLLLESMARRDILTYTALEADKRLVKLVLLNTLPSVIKNVHIKATSWKKISEDNNSNHSMNLDDLFRKNTMKLKDTAELRDDIMPQLSMYFASNGLSLLNLAITSAIKYSLYSSDKAIDYVDIDAELLDSEHKEEQSNLAANTEGMETWLDSGSWTDGGWSNSSDSWMNDAWCNSADSGSCTDRKKTVDEVESNPVSEKEAMFRASTPKGVTAGEKFPLVITMYSMAYQKEAETIIQSVSDDRTEAQAGLFEVNRASQVSIQLFSKDIPIENDLCEQKWNGKLSTFHFLLDLPENYTKKTVGIQCRVYVDKVHLTDLIIIAHVNNEFQELGVEMRKIMTAFASYSSKDRSIVAARLQGMLAATNDKMDVFFDVESLHTGEDWETKIRNEIKNRSIFYLFWSRNARMSEWVQKELSMALELKELQDIEPIPLEAPDVCPPPESLNRKHFFSRLLNYTDKPIIIESEVD